MKNLRDSGLWGAALRLFFLTAILSAVFLAKGTVRAEETVQTGTEEALEPMATGLQETEEAVEPVATDLQETETIGQSEDAPPVPSGLVSENGKYYYYENGAAFTGGLKAVEGDGGVLRYYFFQEDGSAFTGGYKPVDLGDGRRAYYYFQADGTAYTGGYLRFEQNGAPYFFYFQEDGTAFTGGYKEIAIDGQTYGFYFLPNGQGYHSGYKTVMIDGQKYYFFFGDDGRAAVNTVRATTFGERTAYFFLQENGRAFTNGYKEVAAEGATDYYYFLQNGQAFTTGYKTVTIDGNTCYFYFESNGKAFTGGLKNVPFGSATYQYYFQPNGRALTSAWTDVNGGQYYMQANGRASKGWFAVGSDYYYGSAEGAIMKNTVVQGYKLDASGKCPTKSLVIEYVNKVTKPSMSKQQKIKAIYDWIQDSTMTYIRNNEHVKTGWVWKDSWVDDMAASLIKNWGGNCFRYASMTGMMIHEATGYPVKVFHGSMPDSDGELSPHGWIIVYQDGAWYSYDAELDKFSSYGPSDCYKKLYTKSKETLYFEGVGTALY